MQNSFVVFLNGVLLGVTKYADRFVKNFRKLRRAGLVNEFISIHTNTHQAAVHIASDGGRICRPMIIVENGKSKVTQTHIQVKI